MKKKFLGGAAAIAIAALAAFNMNVNNQEELSAISLANIEALASGEDGGWSSDCIRWCVGVFGTCEGNSAHKGPYLCMEWQIHKANIQIWTQL